jgi:hypothetical protein
LEIVPTSATVVNQSNAMRSDKRPNVELTGAARLHRAASDGMIGSATFVTTRAVLCAQDLPR